MKNIFLVGSFLILAVIFSGCGNKATIIPEENDVVDAECLNICQHITETCPSLMMVNNCEESCVNWGEETKEEVSQLTTCQEIMENKDVIQMLIPEIQEPELDVATNDCEAACNKYVIACLTFVPNATADLFAEGYESCLGECKKWDNTKVNCMINAFDCEAMTDVCGL